MTMKLNELKFHEKDRPVRDFFYSQYFYLKNIWREQKSIFLFNYFKHNNFYYVTFRNFATEKVDRSTNGGAENS